MVPIPLPEGSEWDGAGEAAAGAESADREGQSGPGAFPAEMDGAGEEAAGAAEAAEATEATGAEDAAEPGKGAGDPAAMEVVLKQIPAALRREMEELLRAEFREVRPYEPRGK